MGGHLFITHGDLLRLSCDAILIPSGTAGPRSSHIQPHWRELGIADREGFVEHGADATRPVAEVRHGSWPEPAIWLGHVGDIGRSPEDDAGVLDDFVRRAAEPVAKATVDTASRPLGDPRPLLGVPLVGTGAGGLAHVKGEVVRAVIERLGEAVAEVDADVVLVLRDEGDYAAAQQARSRLSSPATWGGLTPELAAEAERLAREAARDRLVLFLGAGASMGANLPSWSEMLDELLAMARDHDDPTLLLSDVELRQLDSRDVGTLVERALGVPAMREAVCKLIGVAGRGRVSLVHQLLASTPIHEAITTNYDLMFEQAWRDAGRNPTVLPREQQDIGREWLLKLHGSVDDPDRIVLTRGDYLRFEGEASALAGVVYAMLLTRHLLFVGYSLSDDNFHRIVYQVRTTLSPYRSGGDGASGGMSVGTVLTPEPPSVLRRIWEPDVRFASTSSASGHGGIREQAIFLDRLAAQTSPPGKHLLDPAYEAVFTKEELQLRRLVEDLQVAAQNEKVRPALQLALEQALGAFHEHR